MINIKKLINTNNSLNLKTKNIIIFIIMFLIIYPSPIFAALMDNKDLHGVLNNIKSIFPALTKLILGICFVCGLGFFIRGAWVLHTFGQMQNQLQKPNGLASPFIYILVGAMLIYLPSNTNMFSSSIFANSFNNIFGTGNSSEVLVLERTNGLLGGELRVQNNILFDEAGGTKLMNYVELGIGVGLEWADLMNTIITFVQLVGFIAFVRGWFIISHTAEPSGQQGTFGKGLIHLIGGIISINFVPFIETIADLAMKSRN